MFMLFYDAETKTVKSLNGSGRCPAALTAERVRADLIAAKGEPSWLPDHRRHIHSCSVPGAAAGWCDAIASWGSGMPLSEVLAPAVSLAAEGFPVSPMSALMWAADTPALTQWKLGGHPELLLVDDAAAPGAWSVYLSVCPPVRD
eukprot:SAG22_NODE_4985_length_1115_cov_1.418307_1_plen_145_part_10